MTVGCGICHINTKTCTVQLKLSHKKTQWLHMKFSVSGMILKIRDNLCMETVMTAKIQELLTGWLEGESESFFLQTP
jgi:hypothetical protein